MANAAWSMSHTANSRPFETFSLAQKASVQMRRRLRTYPNTRASSGTLTRPSMARGKVTRAKCCRRMLHSRLVLILQRPGVTPLEGIHRS